MRHTYYDVLGLRMTATADEIKQAYRQYSLQYSPDKNDENKESKEYFNHLTEAYTILSDEETRRAYDAILRANSAPEIGEENIHENGVEVSIFMEEMVHFTEELTNQNLSPYTIFSELVRRGCPGSIAYVLTETVDSHRKLTVYRAAMIAFLQAGFWITLGGLIIFALYFLGKPIQTYILALALALFLFGVWHCLRAAFYLVTGKLPAQTT
ncbi:MAG: J domain-containing protein [Gloeobacterales cyanobacterium]